MKLLDHPSTQDFETFLHQPVGEARNPAIVSHLLAGCDTCRRSLEALGWSADRLGRLVELPAGFLRGDGPAPASRVDYSRAFAASERAVTAMFSREQPSRISADELWAELSLLEPAEQVRLVRTEPRFAHPGLVRQLLDDSRAARYQDPARILHLSHLACLAAEACTAESAGSSEKASDLRGQAWRQFANALRVQGRLPEAEKAFAKARKHLEQGTGDPPLRARLLAQTASLRIFQRRFADAVELTRDAGQIYRELGDRSSLASTLVQMAVAQLYAGDAEEAVRTLNRAIPMIQPEADPHLLLAACHNLIRCYIDLERPEQALSLYFDVRDLYHEFDDVLILLRSGWQEGQLLRDLGHLRAAESALLRARQGFMERELLYEVALVSLDLAAVYVRMNEVEKLRQTVAETVPIFRALGVDREALASLLQLQQLAHQGRQAFELIRLLNSQVERMGHSAGR
jgi:tetratricopeptide (TPR) repeat protein